MRERAVRVNGLQDHFQLRSLMFTKVEIGKEKGPMGPGWHSLCVTADRLQARACWLPGLSAQNAACQGPAWRRDASRGAVGSRGYTSPQPLELVLSLQFAKTVAKTWERAPSW